MNVPAGEGLTVCGIQANKPEAYNPLTGRPLVLNRRHAAQISLAAIKEKN